jgi:hypothetical protein
MAKHRLKAKGVPAVEDVLRREGVPQRVRRNAQPSIFAALP